MLVHRELRECARSRGHTPDQSVGGEHINATVDHNYNNGMHVGKNDALKEDVLVKHLHFILNRDQRDWTPMRSETAK